MPMHGELDSMARENNNIGEGDIWSGDLNDLGSIGPNRQKAVVGNGPNYSCGGDGPTPGSNHGKRFRMGRSPPSIGSMHGPSQRLFGQSNILGEESLDLNTHVKGDIGRTVRSSRR
ncbi:hypothetical protein Hanom_Chr05g00424031 [Helianthus anomalus]